MLSRHQDSPYSKSGNLKPFDQAADGTLIGEGAAAVVLKRLSDARQDGDRIYAVIRGVGTAIGGDVGNVLPSRDAYRRSVQRACHQARTGSERITFIETDGSGDQRADHFEADILGKFVSAEQNVQLCHIGSVKAAIGHAGAAAGLASVVKTALCLAHRIIPPLHGTEHLVYDWIRDKRKCSNPVEAQYWLTNAAEGRRQALICGLGGDGSCSHAVMEEYDKSSISVASSRTSLNEGLFVLQGSSADEIIAVLARLDAFVQRHDGRSVDSVAGSWFAEKGYRFDGEQTLCLVADRIDSLRKQIAFAAEALRVNPDQAIGPNGRQPLDPSLRDHVFTRPIRWRGRERLLSFFPVQGIILLEWGGSCRHSGHRSTAIRIKTAAFWLISTGRISSGKSISPTLFMMIITLW